jgi:hypothetical protein
VYRVFSCAVAVVLVDSGDYVTYVDGLEECCYLLVQIFGSLVGSERFWMSSQLNDQAAVRVDEVVLVGKMMKPKRLKVYARSGLISTKLPIVKDLIEIITHRPMYQNNMKMVLDTYTAIQEGFDVKPRHM